MSNKNTIEKIKAAISELRPYIQEDGGDVAFSSFDEKTGVVGVELQGHCVGCPLSEVTLKQGLADNLKKAVPEVRDVIAVDEF